MLPPPRQLHNLPTQLSSFIGREREIAEVRRLLGTTRLLTLTGAGGCGKTRLAIQVATELVAGVPDGVWMADLTPLSRPDFVGRSVATALGLPEQRGQAIEDTLAIALRAKASILLLDNCEHLVVACASLVEKLLHDCPKLRIVTTSREPLALPGERRWTVPPLSLPAPDHPATVSELMKTDAVRLFADRAEAANSAFAITGGNALAVADLCRRLDGIPLAIEMASAWVRVLTVEEIVERLSDRFRLLTTLGKAAVPRHQTLRTAIDWSYELLSQPERTLLSRLSVFAGGCSLEAAETICGCNGVEPSTVFVLLANLVDKSLVVADTAGGGARYRLLETIRRYAAARLDEAGETSALRTRHRDWYLDLAETGAPKLRTPEQLAWLQRLEIEHDNLRAALWWSNAVHDAEMQLRLAASLHQFWFIRGYFTEGRMWLEQALSGSPNTPEPIRALALCGAGLMAWRQGDSHGGELLQQSLELFREVKDRWGVAYAVHHLAHVVEEAALDRATVMFQESVDLFRDVGDRWGIGWSLLCLGQAALLQGDDESAVATLEESLALCREVGNMHSLAYVLEHLGTIAGRRGDYDQAMVLLEEALAIARQILDKYHIPFLHYELASVSIAQGDTERALTLLKNSVTLSREVGDKPRLGVFVRGLVRLASLQSDYTKAARLIGVIDALQGSFDFERLSFDRKDYERCVALARSSLGPKDFAMLRAQGRTMDLDQAIEYALAPARWSARQQLTRSATGTRAGSLAPRERQVSGLIAEGKTNREIAAQLSISEGTVEAHVQHILNKLGVNSRAQIAAWVVAQRAESPLR